MQLIQLKEYSDRHGSAKLMQKYQAFEKLILELQKKEIPAPILDVINGEIDKVNDLSVSDKGFLKQMLKSKNKIVQVLDKELKIVTINHYRNIWLAVGMGAFGLPFGLILGFAVDNIGLMGIGLPFGMAIGIAIGISLDKKAKAGNWMWR